MTMIFSAKLNVVTFTVYGQARPAGSKVIGYTKDRRPYIHDAGKDIMAWRKTVAQEGGIAMMGTELLVGPVRLLITVYTPRPKGHYRTGKHAGVLRDDAPTYPTKKPDLTKLVRGIEDALTGIVWRDDSQVVEQENRKLYGEPARVVITIGVM